MVSSIKFIYCQSQNNVQFSLDFIDPTRNQLTDDEMQLIIGNQTLVNNATQPASCPLNEAKHVKLIPIENLVVPRTFSDAIQQAYPCMAIPPSHLDIDKVLSLTKVEKSQSHADLVLKPIPSGSRNRVIFMEPDIEEAKLFSGPSGYPMPPAPPMDQRDDLTLEQRKEEQNKFLRACWRNEMRRRRSLCSISSNDDLVDAELYNSILKKAKMNSARKVKSMPTMVIQPFGRVPSFTTTYSTDALGDSPILSPPTPLGSDGSSSQRSTNFSRSSSMGSFHDDWKNAMKSESYSRKAFRISNEGTRHTSKTSIWSTVASENAADVVQESEDDETDRWDAPPPNVPAIINFLEAPSHNNSVNATAGNADEDEDDPGDTLSPQLLESKPSIGRKQSLTALDFIVKSVKSVGYAPKKDDSIRSMTPLESDQLPSGIFVPVTKSKTSSELLGEESSITHLFQQSPHSFWSTSIQSPSIKRVSS
ncbi:uncharacterized protein LOC118436211 [Folsomia candida]|uniref:uncharacterized protein LOC118436211 n=1 Tax=Folsomia candida TaxID=158441 RepID=UPI001604C6D1|nr:uncharacterized protein LOC118436211 [Folsomia candida]